ncbi:MAG: glycosyltransferase [bacterium]
MSNKELKKPEVSIIMNCLNSEKYLREAIDSIYAQTFTDWEIIFWDNGSVDDSPKIANSYDEKLKYFRSEEKVPLGQARNHASENVNGKYIAFLDTDDIWMKDKLELQIPIFEKDKEVGLVFSDAVIFYQDGSVADSLYLKPNGRTPRGRIFPYAFKYFDSTFCMPTIVLRKEAFDSNKEKFKGAFHICPDFEFFLRVAYYWKCDYIDKPLACYRVHRASVSKRHCYYVPREIDETVDGFHKLQPDFNVIYKKEIKFYRLKVDYLAGKSLWMEGKLKEARKLFKKHLNSPKILFVYFAAFFRFSLMENIWYYFKDAKNKIKKACAGKNIRRS